MAAAKKMRRIKIKRANLFGIVAIFLLATIAGLILWTILDPPVPTLEFFLQDDVDDKGETIVNVQGHCKSDGNYWMYGAMFIHLAMLLWAAVLAFQTRHTPQHFRESTVLAAVIYAQFAFLACRLILFLMPTNVVSPVVHTTLVSLLTALDSMITLCIYFAPKLFFFSKSEASAAPRVESSAPQQWPPSASSQGPAVLATQGSEFVSQDSESEHSEKSTTHQHQSTISLPAMLRPKRAKTKLLQQEKDVATILVEELRSQKEALQRQVWILTDNKAALEGRLEELEDEIALLKGEEGAIEKPPADEEIIP